jgi:hypothetical protein
VRSVLFALTTGACWTAAGYRLRHLRRGATTPAAWAVTVALTGAGIAMLLQIEAVIHQLDRWSGRSGTGLALGNTFVLSTAATAQLVLIYVAVSSPAVAHNRARQRALGMGTVITILASIFLFAPTAPLHDQLIEPSGLGLSYSVLFTTALGIAGADVARMAWWGARVSDRPYLQLGLRLVALAGLLSVTYALAKNIFVALRWRGWGTVANVEQIAMPTLVIWATAMFAIGTSMSFWGPRLGLRRPVLWLMSYQDHRALRPLWLDLYRIEPGLALDDRPSTSAWSDTWVVRHLNSRVYRRFVEIRDGLLLLRPWFDPRVEEQAWHRGRAIGLVGVDLTVVVEASVVAAALAARSAGIGPTDPPRLHLSRHHDVEAETRWLRRVATAYHTSPVVQSARLVRADVDES